MLIDNFAQHFESCVLNAQNTWKSARNQINTLNTLKNEPMNIFHGFRVFEYALWQKNKNPETPEINRKLSKSKAHCVNGLPLLENC